MKYDIMSQAAKHLQEHKNSRRWLTVFLCLAATVVLGTLAALKLYGQAMTHKVKVLECELAVHEHTEECYKEEVGKEKELICVFADYVVHVHNDDCYNDGGTLVCHLEEEKVHEHTEECYKEEKVLICKEKENTEAQGADKNSGTSAEPVKGELICGKEDHTHGDSCYGQTLTCEKKEHGHGEACYDAEQNLICEAEEHMHDDTCYGQKLTCEVKEHIHENVCYEWISAETEKEHKHTEACYAMEKVLACGKLELHTHTDECFAKESFDKDGELIEGSLPVCGLLQLEEHVHGENCFKTAELTAEEVAALNAGATLHIHSDECYDEENNLICGHEATHIHGLECYDEGGRLICGHGEGHVHSEECTDAEGNLICEHVKSHVHGKECADAEGNLICGYETASHGHVESCYDIDGNLQCGYETASHVHEESCYDADSNLICGYETAMHKHGEVCYDADGNLTCGYEDIHEHDAGCYDADGNLICGYEDVEKHEHDADCYDADGNLICGYEEARDHEHDAHCYDEGFSLICGYRGVKDHEHETDCYDIFGDLICGYVGVENHEHTAECYDEEGNLICNYEVLEVYDHCQIYDGEKYIVAVRYNDDAKIPEGAYLKAEEITLESDELHYTDRETEYQKMMEDENATIQALLKIGFYLGEQEIEPEMPVTVTVQLLNEDGLAEGRAITIIHFAEKGNEKLDGGKAKNNSTTFRLGEFSEVAIGYGPEEPEKISINVSESFEYENENFRAVFHIEGEALLAVPEKNIEAEESNSETEVSDENSGEAENAEENSKGTEFADENSAETETVEESNTEAEAAEESNAETETTEEGITEYELEFQVEALDENTEEYAEEYAAIAAYAEELDGGNEESLLQVLAYSLSYNGIKLDLTNCQVTVAITPTRALVEEAKKIIGETPDGEAVQNEVTLSVIEVVEYPDDNAGAETETEAADDDADAETETETADDGADAEGDIAINTVVETEEDWEADADVEEDSAQEDDSVEDTDLSADLETDMPEAEGQVTVEITEAQAVRSMQQPMLLTLRAAGTNNTVAVYKTSQANPKFKVQYYANLNVIATTGSNPLTVINTSKSADGSGGNLPVNGNLNVPTKNIYLEKTTKTVDAGNGVTQNRYEVKTTSKLTEVYSAETYEYVKKPGLMYFDKLAKNGNYNLSQIWILKSGRSATSTTKSDWTIYTMCGGSAASCSVTGTGVTHKEGYVHNSSNALKSLHFTNRKETSAGEDLFVLISEGTVIRLVYDPTTKNYSNESKFYDYNISNGKVYSKESNAKANEVDRTTKKVTPNGKEWYMYTEKQGINNINNYPDYDKTAKKLTETTGHLAFGNVNTRTTFGYETWSNNSKNNELNKSNSNKAGKISYGGLTFKLAKSLDTSGKIVYSTNVRAPKLFNEGSATGKTSYDGTLTFSREGDTYTLTTAKVTDTDAGKTTRTTSNLNYFNHPANHGIWTNSFWPMDSVATAGTDGNDLKFGNDTTTTVTFSKTKYWCSYPYKDSEVTKEFTPIADDYKDHNPYFGMYFTVDFQLTADYVGPLEYLFYGDDDMWVFLSELDKKGGTIKGTGKLICDIGGVHSSVGEYVNLWDWIKKGDTKAYRLSFFYTERGASGSSCWMQFTLPSVSDSTPSGSYGSLRIEKEVVGTENVDEFGFEMLLKDASGNQLKDNYPYSRYSADGTLLKDDVLIWDGGSFELKAGEYIVIDYLPVGTQYEITEIGPVVMEQVNVNGELVAQVKRDKDGKYIRDESADNYFASATGGTNSSVAGANPQDKRVIKGTIAKKDTKYTIKYTNTFQFALPETGGPGQGGYTIAGAIILIFGTGFMYRKKFRERRA